MELYSHSLYTPSWHAQGLLCTLMLKYFAIKCHIKWATLETSRVKPNLIRSTDGL